MPRDWKQGIEFDFEGGVHDKLFIEQGISIFVFQAPVCPVRNNRFHYFRMMSWSNNDGRSFANLFKQQTDVPYRRFRTWKRLFLALDSLSAIDNMTVTALDAGFSDAAPFSHSFRETFGINPAYVFWDINRFEA